MSWWSRRSGGSTPRLSVRSGETKGFFYFYFIFFYFLFWQKGDETQLQNPSPRHRRVWQVDFHEEPQGCPWLRLLHEGEARCPWSEFEHFVAGPRVCFYVSTGDCQQPGHHCVPDSVSDGPSKGEHLIILSSENKPDKQNLWGKSNLVRCINL